MALARTEAATLGLSALPLVELPHPVGSIPLAALRTVACSIIDQIVDALTRQSAVDEPWSANKSDDAGTERVIEAPADPALMFQYFINRGWSDGLPVLAPTEAAVEEMIAAGAVARDAVFGVILPLNGIATAEKIAANAVMAGCLPEYFPLLLAALRCVVRPGFNLDGVQTTTGNVAPLTIVNGPCRQRLQINSGGNALGQGWRANATIGRALRLVLCNIGGAAPGGYDKATLGQPAKYTFCLGENEEENPWEPLHVERGLEREADAVSAFGCSGVNSAVDMASQTAKGLLKTFALTMVGGFTSGVTSTETLLIVCPEHAAILAEGGYSKAAIRAELFELARVPHDKISDENLQLLANRRPKWFRSGASEVPVIDRPEDLWIVVAGGKGAKSAYIPGRTGTKLQTAVVETPALSCRC